MTKRLSTKDVASLIGVCKQRVSIKIRQGHYRDVTKCECGQTNMIPISEVTRDMLIPRPVGRKKIVS